MATPPTFVAKYETVWTSSATPKTASVTVAAGDVLVILVGDENGNGTPTFTASGVTGASWTVTNIGTAVSDGAAAALVTTAPTAGTYTLSVANSSAGTSLWGFNCLRFSGASSVAIRGSVVNSSTGTWSVTTTGANSTLAWIGVDWNAIDGTTRAYSTATAGAFTEETYFRNTTNYGVYAGFHANSGAAGAKTIGVTTPTGMLVTGIAVEVLGTAGGSSFSGSLALSGSGTIAGTGTPAIPGTRAATGSGTLTFAATVALAGSLALSGSSGLTLTGAPGTAGGLSTSGSGTLALSGQPGAAGTLALTGSGSIALSGSSSANPSGTLALTGSGSLALTGSPSAAGTLVLGGAGSLTLSGNPSTAGALPLSGSGSLALAGTPAIGGVVGLSGSGTLALTWVDTSIKAPPSRTRIVPASDRTRTMSATGPRVVGSSDREEAVTPSNRTRTVPASDRTIIVPGGTS